jgi:hypothetical protein
MTDNPYRESDDLRMLELARRFPRFFRGLLMPWFTPESWATMRAAAADRDNLHDTFEEFELANIARFNDLISAGHQVEKVEIAADALIAWCAAEGRPLDSRARQMFAVITLSEQESKAGHA